MRLGWLEILLIVLLVFLLFGTKRISAVLGDFAKGIKTFKKELRDDDKKVAKSSPRKKSAKK